MYNIIYTQSLKEFLKRISNVTISFQKLYLNEIHKHLFRNSVENTKSNIIMFYFHIKICSLVTFIDASADSTCASVRTFVFILFIYYAFDV